MMPVRSVNRWQRRMITHCSGGKTPPALSFENETCVALNPAASSMGRERWVQGVRMPVDHRIVF